MRQSEQCENKSSAPHSCQALDCHASIFLKDTFLFLIISQLHDLIVSPMRAMNVPRIHWGVYKASNTTASSE